MGVSLRKRKLPSGVTSLYLDITVNGNRWYESLGIQLGKNRDVDKQGLLLAKAARSQRELELLANSHNLPNIEYGKQSFISFWSELSKSKHKSWRSALKYFIDYIQSDLQFRHLTPELLEGYKIFLLDRVSPNTANLYFSKLIASLNIAFRRGIIPANPAMKIENVKRVSSMKNYLSISELQILASTPWPAVDEKKAFLFACFCGLRLCDIRKLSKSSILPSRQIELRQTKTAEPIYLPISDSAYDIISSNLIGEDGQLFTLPVSDGTLWTHIQRWAKLAGLTKHISFGVSRHTFATLLLSNGSDLFLVSKLLGHTDIRHTQVYAKVVDSTKRNAVNRLPRIEI